MNDGTNLPFVSKHLHELADLFAQRNAVYKDNFRMYGRLMEALFPDGLQSVDQQDHNKDHLFMLAMVKLTRYVINYRVGHKDSLDDMIVYLSMIAALDDEQKGDAGEAAKEFGDAIRELAEAVPNIFAEEAPVAFKAEPRKPADAIAL